MSEEAISLWTIYERPRDYPDKFVVRRWRGLMPDQLCQLADDLQGARGLVPEGTVRIPRTPSDDPCIVEVWV